LIGKTVSHYKIIEKLGEGGMGVVYLAEDTKLKRNVALKFLPSKLTRDMETKARFIREAQAASSLDHPNICTIHEINETDDGQLFIVMASYKGQTLKEKIKEQKLKKKEAIDIAIQIANGLVRAHEEGIVHRDIKPANIIITDRGEVKILDFGLAKLAGQAQLTKDSSTLGTVAYMSPEQLGGKEVDQRTDIWSLAVILYEMLTGELPFKGDYEQAVVYSILNEEQKNLISLVPVKSNFLLEVEKIVDRALIKNPDERFQKISQLLADLKSLTKSLHEKTEKKKKSYQFSKPLIILFTVILLTILLAFIYVIIRSDAEKKFQIAHTIPLTTAPGLEQEPTWSPEGTRLAFASDESGNMDIWIRQLAAGQKMNLTKDHLGYDGKPAWSPDGEWIAYVSERDGGGIYLISALGGIAKRIVSLPFAPSLAYMGVIPTICWSPDGKKLAYASAGNLYKVSADGGKPDSIPLPHHRLIIGYAEPAWSPDGERLVCIGLAGPGITTTQIWTVRHDGTDPIALTSGKTFDINPVWSPDGKKIIFTSDRGGIKDVWWKPVDKRGQATGPAQPLTVGVGIGNIALSQDGLHLAYAKISDQSNIYSIPIIKDRTISMDQATEITAENHFIELLSLSPDGKWIAFDSNRSGNQDIWIMHKNGSDLRQFTKNPAHDWAPDWSPDGTKIVFHSFRRGNRDLFIMPVAGGAAIPLTDHPEQDFLPRWSPDGKEVAFFSSRSGNLDVWIIPSKGGEARQITKHLGQDQNPNWSPDGKQIAFSSDRTGLFNIFIKPTDGTDAIQLTHFGWETIQPYIWSSDGKTLYASGRGGPDNSKVNFWAISTEDGSVRPILNIVDNTKEPNYCLTTDGERFYFPLWERIGDLWMANLSVEE
jgi:Tol biopolymer transport system component/tRNA A-37 threonylcarbamoyl transferase component Bud32